MPKDHKQSHTPHVTNGFTPGGHIPEGYSYMQRSHSLVTPTRPHVPSGLSSPVTGKPFPPRAISHNHSQSLPTIDRLMSTADDRKVENVKERSEITDLVAHLPANPKIWTPSQVALYLTFVLGLTPLPIVQDVTAYVRSARMGGKQFLRLREKDLAEEGLNLKWRKLMIEAVKKLRRDCLRGRIWGFESEIQWPRHDDDMDEANESEEVKVGIKEDPASGKGTLKRLRDKKAVRGIITSFESIRDGSFDTDCESTSRTNSEAPRNSLCSSQTSSNASYSPHFPIPAVLGEGYVRERAASLSSLSESGNNAQQPSPRGFSREQIESWFGDLSSTEVEALADELDEEDVRHRSKQQLRDKSASTTSLASESSSEAGPMTPPAFERSFNLTPIDADVVQSIVKAPSVENLSLHIDTKAEQAEKIPMKALRSDVFLSEDEGEAEQIEGARRWRANAKYNPYRGSTYDKEAHDILGISEDKSLTAKKIYFQDQHLDATTLDRNCTKGPSNVQTDCRGLFHEASSDIVTQPEERPLEGEHTQYMYNMSAHEASGASPYKPLSPAMSRRASQRSSNGKDNENVGRSSPTATFSQESLQALLSAHRSTDGAGRNKAENESQWGTTLSRKASSRHGTIASRHGTNSRVRNKCANKDATTAASRMSELFQTVMPDMEMASCEETCTQVLPTKTQISEDKQKSVKVKSMVLVERHKFESLARRMGIMEDQLANLELSAIPSDSDLESLVAACDSNNTAAKESRRPALEDVFTIPSATVFQNLEEEEVETPSSSEQRSRGFFNLPFKIGMMPSYALGLAAGAGFVLMSEVFGTKGRPMP